jgi:hypothetical protein
MARGQFPVTSGAKTGKRRPQKFDSGKPVAARTATGETAGGQMADVVLIGTVVCIFFVAGFAVGVLIVVGVVGRWRSRE